MREHQSRLLKAIFILSTILVGMAWTEDVAFGAEQENMHEARSEFTSTILVIPLKYANAEELAATLTPILPPGVTVVPYSPTNSLIISSNPVALKPSIR